MTPRTDIETLKGLVAEMESIRADYEEFDGDRRGIAECLSDAEYDVAIALAKCGPTLLSELEELREALEAEDDYWRASRALACALPRLRDDAQAAFAAATARRERARSALGGSHA